MLRIIREVQPRWVVGENVLGLVNWNGGLVFDEVQADLEAEGYEVQPFILPAASVNAPHKRDRVWFVAYRNGTGLQKERAEQQTAGIEQYRELEQSTPEPCNTGSGPAPDTDNVRLQQCKTPRTLGKGQKEICGEGHKPSMRTETNECFGVAPDTNSLRHTSCGEGTEAQGIGCGNNGEQKERSEQTEWPNGLLGLQPNASNATSCGRGQVGGQRESRFLNETGEIGNWDNFPTQSPIRTGNDGLPTELDSITFSKWRNESIKAAGNAIVPQVVFQIFKAINEYREKYP
jgi:DNA (cytosine-5)-methyltransferase 1